MSYSKQPPSILRPNPVRATASSAIATAISELEARGICFTRPNEHQLKIRQINYYPGTGTLHWDGTIKALKRVRLQDAIAIIARDAR